MTERGSSPQRSPGLRRVKAMPSMQMRSPITPGPNAFALRLAAAEARSSTPDTASTQSQRSSKSFSQRRTPTSGALYSAISQQTEWPFPEDFATPPEGQRRSEPVHSNKVEKGPHRPTQSSDDKRNEDRFKPIYSRGHTPQSASRGSNERRNARLEQLVTQGGSSIANVRRRAPTPTPLNLEASKALGQKLNSNLQAVHPEPPSSPSKKSLRPRLPFPSLKPTPTQSKYTPEPMKLGQYVPRKAAELLGTKASSNDLFSRARSKTPPVFGDMSDIEEQQAESPLVLRKSRSSNGFDTEELDKAATIHSMNQRLASIHSSDELLTKVRPPTPPEKSESQLRRARSTKLPDFSSSTSSANGAAMNDGKSVTDTGSPPVRLGQAAFKPLIVPATLPDAISFHGSIHDKSPKLRPQSQPEHRTNGVSPVFQVNDYTPSLYPESPFVNDNKASYERRLLPSPLHLQNRKFTPMEPPVAPPQPPASYEQKEHDGSSSARVPLFFEDQHNPRQSMVLAGMLNIDRPSYETMTDQSATGVNEVNEAKESGNQQKVHSHDSYIRCVEPREMEQARDRPNTLSPIRESSSSETVNGHHERYHRHPNKASDPSTATALTALQQKLYEQEMLIHLLSSSITTNHEIAMKQAKTHSTEMTALFKHVADISERLGALMYDQQVEAQIARQRQQEIYHFLKSERAARREARKASNEAWNRAQMTPFTTPRQHQRVISNAEAHGVVARPTTPPPPAPTVASQQQYPTRTSSSSTPSTRHAATMPSSNQIRSPTRSPKRSLSPFRSLDRLRNLHSKKNREDKRTSNGTSASSPVRNSEDWSMGASMASVTSPKRVSRHSNGTNGISTAPSTSAAAVKAEVYASRRDRHSQSQHSTTQHRQRTPERMPRDPADIYEYEYDYDHEPDYSTTATLDSPDQKRRTSNNGVGVSYSKSSSPVRGHGRADRESTDSIIRLYDDEQHSPIRAGYTHASTRNSGSRYELSAPQPIAFGESKSLALLGIPESMLDEGMEKTPKKHAGLGISDGRGSLESTGSGEGATTVKGPGHGKGVLRDYWASLGKVAGGRRSE